jgi:hypothetical protein
MPEIKPCLLFFHFALNYMTIKSKHFLKTI